MSFEKLVKDLNGMEASQRRSEIKNMDAECSCSECPSYMGTGETRLTFCVVGRSSLIKEEKGCICPACPIQTKYGLKDQYYCTRGSTRVSP